jgi:hypothetical protein
MLNFFMCRYYDGQDEWKRQSGTAAKSTQIPYVKIPCASGSVPSDTAIQQFMRVCSRVLTAAPPRSWIGIHDEYGYNATGFMLACFLIEERGWSVDAALSVFQGARFPGLYDGTCRDSFTEVNLSVAMIDDLYRRYDEFKPAQFVYPEAPRWDKSAVRVLLVYIVDIDCLRCVIHRYVPWINRRG